MNKTRIVCYGDSITQGAGLAEADRWTARLAFDLEQREPDRFSVYNRGVGGNTTALALDRFNADLAPLLPALVLIEFGINDAYVYPWSRRPRVSLAEYVRNLHEIVRAVQAAAAMPILIINHPLTLLRKLHPQGNGKSLRENLAPYSTATRRLATRHKIHLIDLPALVRRERIRPATLLASDGVHLSDEGNRVYARLVVSSLASDSLSTILKK
ncbi:MAG: SGNH/GDSL hydrolase family protein [Opitutaceae bacterium]|jgi:lysophospholipase L1-like esterase